MGISTHFGYVFCKPGSLASRTESAYDGQLRLERFEDARGLVQGVEGATVQGSQLFGNPFHAPASTSLHHLASLRGGAHDDLSVVGRAAVAIDQTQFFQRLHDTRDCRAGDHLRIGELAHRIGPGVCEDGEAFGRIHRLLNSGRNEVVDADLSNYFGEIPHAELMKSIARRVSDGRMLGLIKAWLEMPVIEEDGKGGSRRTSRARKERKGTPQGAPISPLLSNIYMRRFILGWKVLGYARRFGAEIVNYVCLGRPRRRRC